MTERGRILAFLLLLFLRVESLLGQTGGAIQPDSDSAGPFLEGSRQDLEEQAVQADGSPILDFSPFDPDPRKRDFFLKIRSRITAGLEESRGYREGQFLGSPVQSRQRAEFSDKRGISGGMLLSKDPGERLLADFVSGYGMITNVGTLATLLVGDYFVEAGQGIALWRGFESGKGADVVNGVKRSGRGILPYRASDENAFLRGVAADLRFDPISLAVFYSRRSLTASIDSSGAVSSITSSGPVRTASENSKRNSLTESVTGFRSSLEFGEGRNAGITFYNADFSLPLHLTGGSRFAGKRYALASVDYHFNLPRAVLFGEWTILSGAAAGISGALLTPSGVVDLIGAFRHYPPRFVSLHGLGFGEQSQASNEEGIYLGLRLKFPRGIVLSAYVDQFRFPEGSATGLFPGGGREWFAQVGLRPDSDLEWLIQYQGKSSERREGLTSGEGLPATLTALQAIERFRAHVGLRLGPAIRLRGRIEKVYLRSLALPNVEQGMMLYEDVACVLLPGLSSNVRIVFFQTGSYETRLYEFENDLKGATSLPLLSGQGERWYILVRYRIGGSCEVSAKYSRMTRDDVERLGTGPDELPGNHDDRIGVQIDLKL